MVQTNIKTNVKKKKALNKLALRTKEAMIEINSKNIPGIYGKAMVFSVWAQGKAMMDRIIASHA